MKSKQKIIIAIGSFVASILAFGAFVLYPLFQEVTQGRAKLVEQRAELAQLNESRNRSQEIEAVSAQYKEEFKQLESLFVDSEIPISLFRFLDEAAASFGLQMEKIPGNTQQSNGDSWPSFSVRLAGEGQYLGLVAFVERIENAPYLMEINGVTITEKGEEDAPDGFIEFSMSVKVFIQEI